METALDERDLIHLAVRGEKEACAAFQRADSEAVAPDVRSMLDGLARQELSHPFFLQSYLLLRSAVRGDAARRVRYIVRRDQEHAGRLGRLLGREQTASGGAARI